mmetsp:Transcript_63498/g.200825  ORF Transcript_63498/g.200825 Transcript_63498/m.200825 type:complete len:227 (-) Transcript_63498:639-1319(-)
MAMDSMNPTKLHTTALPMIFSQCSKARPASKEGSPLSIEPIVSRPRRSRRKMYVVRVPTTVTMSGPVGRSILSFLYFFPRCLKVSRRAIQNMASKKVSQWMFSILSNVFSSWSSSCFLLFTLNPSTYASWLMPMSTAAPLVKPLMTACERKLTMKPILATPMASCTTPLMNPRRMAICTYCSFSSSLSACCEREASTRRDTIATGPTASCREEPINPYTKRGMHAE